MKKKIWALFSMCVMLLCLNSCDKDTGTLIVSVYYEYDEHPATVKITPIGSEYEIMSEEVKYNGQIVTFRLNPGNYIVSAQNRTKAVQIQSGRECKVNFVIDRY